MNRGRIESAGPKDLRKFKAVYTIFEKGYITQEEAARVFEVSIYIWRKWVKRYGKLDIDMT